MRYAVVGVGSVGVLLAARLAAAGLDVVAVPRTGPAGVVEFTVTSARGTQAHPVATVGWPSLAAPPAAELDEDPLVVLLAVKSQDTAAVLRAMVDAGVHASIVCVQNGVDNERQALRSHPDVLGATLVCPVTRTAPYTVRSHATPSYGLLDIGRWPSSPADDPLAVAVAADLTAAGFVSRAVPDISRWKYAKLVLNTLNAVDALCGWAARQSPLAALVRSEALACLAAAGIETASAAELQARSAGVAEYAVVDGVEFTGSSTTQSLAWGAGSVEVDFLNGEICLLGRLLGVPTPANALLQRACTQLAATGAPPGRLDPEALMHQLGADHTGGATP